MNMNEVNKIREYELARMHVRNNYIIRRANETLYLKDVYSITPYVNQLVGIVYYHGNYEMMNHVISWQRVDGIISVGDKL